MNENEIIKFIDELRIDAHQQWYDFEVKLIEKKREINKMIEDRLNQSEKEK